MLIQGILSRRFVYSPFVNGIAEDVMVGAENPRGQGRGRPAWARSRGDGETKKLAEGIRFLIPRNLVNDCR